MIVRSSYADRLDRLCARALIDKPWRPRSWYGNQVDWHGAVLDQTVDGHRYLVTVNEVRHELAAIEAELADSASEWLAGEPLIQIDFLPAVRIERYSDGHWELREFRNPSGEMGGSYLEEQADHLRFDPDLLLDAYLTVLERPQALWLDGRYRMIEQRRARRAVDASHSGPDR